ncbi:MAG: hypothetical protein HZC47_08150 [Methanobacterium sp.]|uniref:hypothetical protein n=1 Tax=Methanobacterium sp. TaxID=2164 RepID=UPI003D662DD6|nr:hypothetical protein [Methanobacterium sp.]
MIYLGYFILFLLFYVVLFTKIGQKISDNKKFTLLIISLLIISSVTLTFLGNNPSINYYCDSDDALTIWINQLFSFQYPYEAVTQLGQQITPFPSLPLYSIPFYLLGNVAYQNIVNLFIIIFILWNFSENRRQLNFGLVSLLICVHFAVSFLNHTDHMTVATFVALGLYLLYKSRFKLSSLIFGLLIASKGYIWFIIPTIICYIFKKENFQNFKKSLLIIILVPLIIVLPFILWNSNIFFHFAPVAAESSLFTAFKYLDIIVTLAIASIALFSYNRTKNLFFAVFIAYLIFEFILPLRSTFLLALSAILLGIYMDKLKIDTNKISDQNPSN